MGRPGYGEPLPAIGPGPLILIAKTVYGTLNAYQLESSFRNDLLKAYEIHFFKEKDLPGAQV